MVLYFGLLRTTSTSSAGGKGLRLGIEIGIYQGVTDLRAVVMAAVVVVVEL